MSARTRLEHVRRQLETTFIPVEAIAASCGFRRTDVMRRAFLRYLQVSASDERGRVIAQRIHSRPTLSTH